MLDSPVLNFIQEGCRGVIEIDSCCMPKGQVKSLFLYRAIKEDVLCTCAYGWKNWSNHNMAHLVCILTSSKCYNGHILRGMESNVVFEDGGTSVDSCLKALL